MKIFNFRFISLIVIFSFFICSCSPANRMEKEMDVDKVDISSLFLQHKSRSTIKNLSPGIMAAVKKESILENDLDAKRFRKLASLPIDAVVGPYAVDDNSIFYLKKNSSKILKYVNIMEAQIGQPFGLDDETFNLELDSIQSICLSTQKKIEEVLKNYESNNQLHIGVSYLKDNVLVSKLEMDLVEYLINSKLYSLYIYRKDKLASVDIAIIYQKIDEIQLLQTIEYQFIEVKRNKQN